MTSEKSPLQQHHHRSSLKQKNKSFKGGSSGRFKSRGRLEGRHASVSSVGISKPSRTTNSVAMTKADRRNQAVLIQTARRAELNAERRLFSGRHGVPRVVFVLPISPSANATDAVKSLTADQEILEANESLLSYNEATRQKIRWVACRPDWNITMISDAASAADVVLFLASIADEPILDAQQRGLFAMLRSQGVSSSLALLHTPKLAMDPPNATALKGLKSAWQQIFNVEMSSVSKMFVSLAGDREASELLRTISNQKLAGISWREIRPYLLADSIEYDQNTGELILTGFCRGGHAFSANRLVHLQSCGTFGLSRINLLTANSSPANEMMVDELEQKMDLAMAESLQAEQELMENEACHETLSVIKSASLACTSDGPKTKKIRVPKGTSAYQAAWIVDEVEEACEIGDDNEEKEELELVEGKDNLEEGHDVDNCEMDVENDDNEEREAYKNECASYKHFPDQVDVPDRQPARERFHKYRGLQSLRTSYWDPEENLPIDYGRIFQFENWARSKQTALSGQTDTFFSVGQRIALHLSNVPANMHEALMKVKAAGLPTLVYGLLPHEQKTSVLHFTVTLRPEITKSLLGKEEVIAWFGGFRRYIIKPVFSEHNPTSNLHRVLQEVEPGITAVGTVYAPIHYPPGPVLLFSPATGELLATGSILEANPHRIMLKRITLTAAPYKVNRRAAVARWMFANPADVAWFKPIELVTLSGRRGAIRESLGTHGHFKCLFDRPIAHDDVIAMHLYKRTFPKWNTTRLLSGL